MVPPGRLTAPYAVVTPVIGHGAAYNAA